ncbi:multicopper oxidase family protein [Fructilactobacillus fructivorans]|uniref:multicopper oxidase family protein n=1 Tax=Fructilactobacillus fructivorans TaxID=1614 RepID=UPI00070554A6|nr:multicopper oxidase domain-containing protein [Fructilactobacillus fructivorans]KRN39881.1 Bilirubin oxidase [Fructilactobacillus fructivorans]KRN42365.1 Bilirubin oxidase [Fructilactobacillus fructivorans]
MSERKVYNDYFYDEPAFNTHDGGYIPLEVPDVPEHKLNIPGILKPDKETDTDMWYTVDAQPGETQILPGEKTKTWGYNSSILGKTIILKEGKHMHVTLKNDLPVLTTFHWHGLNVSGPYVDGGCHAPVYPGTSNEIEFTVDQPAATLWLHAHPCPETSEQVYKGLATPVVVQDDIESKLPFPRNYGVDDIPVVLQDRHFHKGNQLNYKEDYDPDGVQGPTAMINGTVNPYFDVTTQKVRLRFLDGSNRREWRLHFDDDLKFTQIGSDGGILPEPVEFTHLMMVCAERDEVIVDFSGYKPGDEVHLYSDDVPIMTFKIHEFAPDDTKLPDHLIDMPPFAKIDKDAPVHKAAMSGMDESVEINGKKFDMQRIDDRQEVGKERIWEVSNSNEMDGGMVHPYHMHGTQFRVLSRNGKDPYPNEHGWKDTIGVNPGEVVRLQVKFDFPGVYMYHCHITEHEDGGMMLQIQAYDKQDPHKKYKLMNMDTLLNALSKEEGIPVKDLDIPAMNSYKKMGIRMC